MNFKILLITILLFLLTGCGEKLAGGIAKEICSCRFLVKRSLKQCKKDISKAFLFGGMRVDEKRKIVTGVASGHRVSFRFISEREGCRLNSLN